MSTFTFDFFNSFRKMLLNLLLNVTLPIAALFRVEINSVIVALFSALIFSLLLVSACQKNIYLVNLILFLDTLLLLLIIICNNAKARLQRPIP